jgi:hypothetical protein
MPYCASLDCTWLSEPLRVVVLRPRDVRRRESCLAGSARHVVSGILVRIVPGQRSVDDTMPAGVVAIRTPVARLPDRHRLDQPDGSGLLVDLDDAVERESVKRWVWAVVGPDDLEPIDPDRMADARAPTLT